MASWLTWRRPVSDRAFNTLLIAAAYIVIALTSDCSGAKRGRAQATCYAAHLPYVETTSAGVVCGEPAVLLPILTEVKP